MKKVIALLFFISVFVCAFFSGCYHKTYDASADLPVIEESDVAYLLDDAFVLSADNFATYFNDYLLAPAVLYFDYENSHYRCEDASAAVAFADVIGDAAFVEITYDEFSEIANNYDPSNYMKATYPSLGFTNIAHSISFVFAEERTYIACFRDMTSPICFMVEEDLYSDFTEVADTVISVSKPVSDPDELTQFE